MDKLISKIENYPDDFLAIKKQAKKYLSNNSNIDDNETLNIFHRPWVAPLNWGLILYTAARKNWLDQFEQKTRKTIPNFYKKFLTTMNGCFIYDLSLYGLPPSFYLKETLDRSQLQCQDLLAANNEWILEYNVDKNYFHFGSRAYSHDQNVGYFFWNDEIRSVRTDGKTVSTWNNFSDFLDNEILEAENMMLEEVPKGTKISSDE